MNRIRFFPIPGATVPAADNSPRGAVARVDIGRNRTLVSRPDCYSSPFLMIDLGGGTRPQGWRLATAAVLAILVSLTAGVTPSSARISHQDLVAAEDQLASLNGRLSLLVEEYDQAALALAKTKMQLADAQRAASQAQAAADAARAAFAGRARAAYEGAGSQLDILLGATSFQQFSDRLQY